MKIDFHVHITPPEIIKNWQKYAEKEPYFSLLSAGKHNKFAEAEDVIAALDAGQFDHAVVFGFAFKDPGLCRYVNDYVIEKTRQFPDRLTGFIAVTPACGKPENEIERCFGSGLRGVGELFPQGQGFDLDDKKATAAVAGVCKELGIPILLHANEPVGHDYPGKSDVTLHQLEIFIKNNPALDIILAHWGGGIFLYETMPELKDKFRNVYYDTAATPFLYDEKIYNAAKALGLCEKILFGSDFPLLPHCRYFDALEKCCLSGKEKKLILGENAKKLLCF